MFLNSYVCDLFDCWIVITLSVCSLVFYSYAFDSFMGISLEEYMFVCDTLM